ncbi:hypothetical protein M758_9G184400 [Ceratodon purpureus]|nr:hypothetical protein M758_9G184400 [Ceratodon purpureus]
MLFFQSTPVPRSMTKVQLVAMVLPLLAISMFVNGFSVEGVNVGVQDQLWRGLRSVGVAVNLSRSFGVAKMMGMWDFVSQLAPEAVGSRTFQSSPVAWHCWSSSSVR